MRYCNIFLVSCRLFCEFLVSYRLFSDRCNAFVLATVGPRCCSNWIGSKGKYGGNRINDDHQAKKLYTIRRVHDAGGARDIIGCGVRRTNYEVSLIRDRRSTGETCS
jgi:hypothetical protein